LRAVTAGIIDGKAVSEKVRADVAREVEAWVAAGNPRPGLATILVGDDPASAVYVANKRKACVAAGIADLHRHLPVDTPQEEVAALIYELADDPAVSGILLQLPVPPQLDAKALIALIPPFKDVDGLTAYSAGLLATGSPGLRPCTPSGVVELLDHYGVELHGKEAVVVGRSHLVGRPTARLLLARNATVTIAHRHTAELAPITSRADVLVVATGVPGLITPAHVKPGAVVIDVGISRTPEGLVGDVDFGAVAEVASLITPVPGGVGPMTIAMLLRNTLSAARLQQGQ
jgi:methylenetetrahydrofolate dehydrogenase (NADP+)/methenyltetrahydrofolate cyclohydrolase